MDNHIEFQDNWKQDAFGDLTLHDSDFERNDRIKQECAEWETHSEPRYKEYGTNEPYLEPEPIGCLWSHETLLTCVQ